MKEIDLEKYPVIEKSIPIDAGEYWRLTRINNIEQSVRDQLLDMLIKACTKLEDRKIAMWNEIAQRFGFKELSEATIQGKCVEISWATRQINLRSKK